MNLFLKKVLFMIKKFQQKKLVAYVIPKRCNKYNFSILQLTALAEETWKNLKIQQHTYIVIHTQNNFQHSLSNII